MGPIVARPNSQLDLRRPRCGPGISPILAPTTGHRPQLQVTWALPTEPVCRWGMPSRGWEPIAAGPAFSLI